MEEPKQRPIVLESHIVAYIGDLVTMVEQMSSNLANTLKSECSKKSSKPSTQSTAAHSPAGR